MLLLLLSSSSSLFFIVAIFVFLFKLFKLNTISELKSATHCCIPIRLSKTELTKPW